MYVEIEEKSLQLALIKAAGQLKVTRDQVDYEVLEESKGFLGLFGKKVKIKARVKSRSSRSRNGFHKRNQNAQKVPNITLDEKSLEVVEKVKDFTVTLGTMITGEKTQVEHLVKGDKVKLQVKSKKFKAMCSRNSKLTDSIEHIIRKSFRQKSEDLPFRVFIDVGGIRKDREEELVSVAQKTSRKVIDKQKPIILNYSNSYDRKIIHMALDNDKRVYTKSVGVGANRKLMVLPSKA